MAKDKKVEIPNEVGNEITTNERVDHFDNAKVLFAGHKDTHVIHFTEDGKAFFERHHAEHHAKQNAHKNEPVTIKRHEVTI